MTSPHVSRPLVPTQSVGHVNPKELCACDYFNLNLSSQMLSAFSASPLWHIWSSRDRLRDGTRNH